MELTYLCRKLGVLPKAGGLLDQDPYHVSLIKAVLVATDEANRREMEKAKNKSHI
jgi:hypothetical protein